MSKSSLIELSEIISTLSGSEKRSFTVYCNRLKQNEKSKYVSLFKLIEKQPNISDEEIIEKTKITKSQLPNVKMNLKKQLLKSLVLNPRHKTPSIELREQINYAMVFYNKGLYRQSLSILESAKAKAEAHDDYTMQFEIIEFEKLIESQYITRSLRTKADDLAVESKNISLRNMRLSKLSNLSLQLYSYLLKNGYAKNEEDAEQVAAYYHDKLPMVDIAELGFKEKLYLFQAQLWYSQIQQDFRSSYRYGSHWVGLFENKQNLIQAHPVYYLKGLNAVLDSLYYLRYLSKFEFYYERLTELGKSVAITRNVNTSTLFFIYFNYNRINKNFLEATFSKGILEIKEIEFGIKKFDKTIDEHHKMVFYYKFACLYFGEGEYEMCMTYLQRILGKKELKIRDDLMCYSHILNIICLYELGRDIELDQSIARTYRFLLRLNEMHKVQRAIFEFLRKLSVLYPQEIHGALDGLKDQLKSLENHPFEKRSFLYLDIISWIESKLEGRPIKEVVKEKAQNLK